jgi:hypothetical protein
MTNYQNIFFIKFLTFFNCHVQLLTDNLQLLEDCQTVHGRNDKPITFAT